MCVPSKKNVPEFSQNPGTLSGHYYLDARASMQRPSRPPVREACPTASGRACLRLCILHSTGPSWASQVMSISLESGLLHAGCKDNSLHITRIQLTGADPSHDDIGAIRGIGVRQHPDAHA